MVPLDVKPSYFLTASVGLLRKIGSDVGSTISSESMSMVKELAMCNANKKHDSLHMTMSGANTLEVWQEPTHCSFEWGSIQPG
jgi:hypothetical protein